MSIIDIDETLDASGSANDEASETYTVRTDSAAVQLAVGGATTLLDFHLETRLADDMAFQDWIKPRTGLTNGYADCFGVDVGDITQIRSRLVNQDGANAADVRAVVVTRGR